MCTYKEMNLCGFLLALGEVICIKFLKNRLIKDMNDHIFYQKQ